MKVDNVAFILSFILKRNSTTREGCREGKSASTMHARVPLLRAYNAYVIRARRATLVAHAGHSYHVI